MGKGGIWVLCRRRRREGGEGLLCVGSALYVGCRLNCPLVLCDGERTVDDRSKPAPTPARQELKRYGGNAHSLSGRKMDLSTLRGSPYVRPCHRASLYEAITNQMPITIQSSTVLAISAQRENSLII